MSEVSKHTTRGSCWFVLEGKVLDVTPFLKLHPGGAHILVKNAGTDASGDFRAAGHSSYALKLLEKYIIGDLEMPKAKL